MFVSWRKSKKDTKSVFFRRQKNFNSSINLFRCLSQFFFECGMFLARMKHSRRQMSSINMPICTVINAKYRKCLGQFSYATKKHKILFYVYFGLFTALKSFSLIFKRFFFSFLSFFKYFFWPFLNYMMFSDFFREIHCN